MGALIYGVYLYYLGKRFYICTGYLGSSLVRGLIAYVKTYLQVCIAEAKFIFKLLRIPFGSRWRHTFNEATRMWILELNKALIPNRLAKILSGPTRMKRLIELLRLLKDALVYVYNCVLMKHLLVLCYGEFTRLKRLVTQTVNRSRRLRVHDST